MSQHFATGLPEPTKLINSTFIDFGSDGPDTDIFKLWT